MVVIEKRRQILRKKNDFKDRFNVELNKFYESQCGTVKKPWTKQMIFEVIHHIKTAKVAMECGDRRNSTQYYWWKKYDIMNVAGEDYLILKKKTPEDPTIRVVPMEQYFDTLVEIHKVVTVGEIKCCIP